MNDRAAGLLEQYEIEVLRTGKGRGAILCDTDRGNLILKEYAGCAGRIEQQDRLLKNILAAGLVKTEQIVPTREGALLVTDEDGCFYVLKTRREGRELNIYDRGECLEAVRLLARLHGCMELPADTPGLAECFSPGKEYEKHNRELKRVRKYLKAKGQKTWFEIRLLKVFDLFLGQAQQVAEEWKQYCAASAPPDGKKKGETVTFCHGDYQYHNIIKGEDGWFLTGFEKCLPDDPVRDLGLFLRKLMEKSSWSVNLGTSLLEAYEEERPLSAQSRMDLYYRLAYPEKFWKIANFYYNSGKAWIPGKNQEKLEKLISQEKDKQRFLEEVFPKEGKMQKSEQ